MKFSEKYSLKTEVGKILVSNDAFAVGDMLQDLIDKLEQTRVSSNG